MMVVQEYDSAAATYDKRWAAYINASVEFALERLEPLLESLPCGDHCAVLDIGCGTGALASALRERHPGWDITCADSCTLMLRQAQSKGLHTAVAYAERLPLRNASAHLAVSLSSFHFWRDRAAGLCEVRRVLRPGGLVFLADWAGDFFSCRLLAAYLRVAGYPSEDADVLTTADAERLLQAAGFEVTRGVTTARALEGVRMRPLGLPLGPRWAMMAVAGVRRDGQATDAPNDARLQAASARTPPAVGAPLRRRGVVRLASHGHFLRTVMHGDSNPWLVEFFDPKCGSCQAFAPVWRELQARPWPVPLRFAAVDVSAPGGMALAERLGALEGGLPHVKLYLRTARAGRRAESDAGGGSASKQALTAWTGFDDNTDVNAVRGRVLELLQTRSELAKP